MLNENPILDSTNQAIALSNLFGRFGITALNGVPLGATGDSTIGELYLKVGIVNGSTTNVTAKANAARPTLVEGTDNPLSQTLDGALRVISAGPQFTPVSALATTGGTVAAGKQHIEFIFSSDFAGNVNGIAYAGGTDFVQTFDAQPGCTFAAIVYTVSAGSVRIISY